MTIIEVEPIEDEPLPELSTKRGFVYVLERAEPNETTETLCKVGYTSISALSRSKDYTDGGWDVYFEEEMQDWLARLLEQDVHKALEEYWLDPAIVGGSAKEIFLCGAITAVDLLQRIKFQRIQHEIEELGGWTEEDVEEIRCEMQEEISSLRGILKEQSEKINSLYNEQTNKKNANA